MLLVSLGAILLARQLWLVVAAQVFFGLATGLIYYSSLFYSMDVGEASSEHGGLHEAFIGAGIFLGRPPAQWRWSWRRSPQCFHLGGVRAFDAGFERVGGAALPGQSLNLEPDIFRLLPCLFAGNLRSFIMETLASVLLKPGEADPS